MELDIQFNKTILPGLQTVLRQTQSGEQTQEIRLPEGMPDIGRVVGCWGQVVIRGKEWHSDRIGVSGGVMAWVLYVPEDAGVPQCVDVWLPFQMKWDIPPTRHDGTVTVQPFLRSADARSLSARKLMVRTGVAVTAHAVAAADTDIYSPGELPPDIRLLKKKYPMRIAQEAGEKAFRLEEGFSLPGSMPPPAQLIRYELRPELTDWKLMGDKVVFRGAALLHILYRCKEGRLYTFDQELPFSQYADLDGEYGDEGLARVIPMVTNLELDLESDGRIQVKAGLSGQYTVYGCPLVEIVEDAYSPDRSVSVQTEFVQIPTLLHTQNRLMRIEQTVESDAAQVLDLALYPDSPIQLRADTETQTQLPGTFQLLYQDLDGNLQSTNAYWEETMTADSPPDTQVVVTAMASGIPQALGSANGVALSADLLTDTDYFAGGGIPMVTGLSVGEQVQPDPQRPSLIIRKMGSNSLWDIAKATGSTVERIMSANRLTEEPEPEKVILIPIP